ncbi:thermopsin [Sulfolobales archaeon HS-7]|nr:thermopsin [Sulfolobales archaeon HS-7]
MRSYVITVLFLFLISFIYVPSIIPSVAGFAPSMVSGYAFPPAPPVKNASVVNPYEAYSSYPAPIGISFLGLGPNGPCTVQTTQVKGDVLVCALQGISHYPNGQVSDWIDFQLNAVLTYVQGGNTYSLWIQDIAIIHTTQTEISFDDNVWNFSARDANVSGLSGNGKICPDQNDQTYYYYEPAGYPGSNYVTSTPYTIKLMMNVTTNSLNEPVICFWYNDGFGWIKYDTVTVDSPNSSNVYITITGENYTPSGYYYDLELVMAGGNGLSCGVLSQAEAFLSLYYYNGHNFQEPLNTYNFGVNTGERVKNVNSVSCYYLNTGCLVAGVFLGTGSLGTLYTQNQVSEIKVHTGFSEGDLIAYNSSLPLDNATSLSAIPYQGGCAILVLEPMSYGFLSYESGSLQGEAELNAKPGGDYTITTPTFSVTASTTSLLVDQGTQGEVTLNVVACGDVQIQVSSSLTTNLPSSVQVNGETELNLVIPPNTPLGNYVITVTLTLLPGLSKTIEIDVLVVLPKITVTVSANLVGNSPSSPLSVLFTFPNGTTESVPVDTTVTVPSGTEYQFLNLTMGNERWVTLVCSGVLESSGTITATYYEQFVTTFSYSVQGGQGYGQPFIVVCYFGSQESVSPGSYWVDAFSSYHYPRELPGSGNQERWITSSTQGEVNTPGLTVSPYYVNEYYLTVPVIINATVNSTSTELTSGWFVQGTTIHVDNNTIYLSKVEREVITSVSTGLDFTVDQPLTVQVKTLTQFLVTVNSPIPVRALINGTNTTLLSGWYNANTTFHVLNLTYSPSTGTRYVILSAKPLEFVLDNGVNVTVTYQKQEYLTVNSPIPLKGYFNSTSFNVTSGWYPYDSSITVANNTYYVNNETRCVITSVTPETFTLTSPQVLTVNTVKQFLTDVNGVKSWVNQGTQIRLTASIPIYEVGKYVGTYNVSVNSVITVNSPLTETLVLSPNFAFYGIVGAIVAAIAGVVIYFERKR